MTLEEPDWPPPEPDDGLPMLRGSEWGLSAAEEEYAQAYADALAVGDVRPEPDGLDVVRAAAIRSACEEWWTESCRRMYRRRR